MVEQSVQLLVTSHEVFSDIVTRDVTMHRELIKKKKRICNEYVSVFGSVEIKYESHIKA